MMPRASTPHETPALSQLLTIGKPDSMQLLGLDKDGTRLWYGTLDTSKWPFLGITWTPVGEKALAALRNDPVSGNTRRGSRHRGQRSLALHP
jgi:hypothetical protein